MSSRFSSVPPLPFDATACRNATADDISPDRIRWFLAQARQREYLLADTTPVVDVLAHLNLLDHGHPSNAAILLFGKQPQRFLLTSEVKCLHFHGIEVRKPIPSYQVYKGTCFELVDQAVDFVMSKLARSVGSRAQGPQAPIEYEIPHEAVAEAIVNAVAHRDYISNASVQVMLFADRLEVWNPGELPPSLTPERLSHPHASIPRNSLLSEPLFLARYVERAGTGTLDMIALSKDAGLKPPEFREDGGQFVQTLWRPASQSTPEVTPAVTPAVTPEVAPAVTPEVTPEVTRLLRVCGDPLSRQELQDQLGLKDDEHFRKAYLLPALTAGFIEMTVPDRPTSRFQKYRMTAKGHTWLAQKEQPRKRK